MFFALAAASAASELLLCHTEQQSRLARTQQEYYEHLCRSVPKTHETKPCPYCGRTKQTFAHKSCDGCGSSKPEVPKIHAENVYGYNILKPHNTAKVMFK